MKLRLDDADLASCVACGLCLPHCPTYRVTGDESASPRGRIGAMRAVQWDGAAPGAEFETYMDLCVQCRGCEVACPSSVPFGRLMEGAREAVGQPWWRRVAYAVLGYHRLLLALSTALAVAQRFGLVPRRFGLPRLPLRRPVLESSGTDVWLFTGCVMDAWMRDTHAAVKRVLEAAGAGVAVSEAACCGALHVHAGLKADARRLAERTMAAMPGEAPILVDSAGCGAALKDYGHLLGSKAAREFSARVLDVHEWLAPRVDKLPTGHFRRRVAVQDPCHLRHVQGAHDAVRMVLGLYAELAELDDDGLCCGAGGAYAAQHAEMAGAIRDRKVAAVQRTGAPVVASANPGCAMHLAAAGLTVRHPLEIVDEVLRNGR
ncbi:MAG TPA: heterodisulfide reductase-related iron-sulfur binding cluster [Acidimicrobiales bacterium]|nr:heterodisulfide reductase-related iron-sulfur binding cluster [Acidimicrobiales bacterium]